MGTERVKWRANNRELERMAERGVFGNGTPNLGDFTKIDPSEWTHVEWLVGGTPCQAFSVAGARQGLKDHRGNLALAFVGLAHELASTGSLRGAIWENVPGVLSDKHNAFGCFLGALVGHDAPIVSPHRKGRWTDAGVVVGPRARAAWRILDAQHFRLAQRRRRVFVVVSFGDGPDPVEILFEPKGVLGAFAPGDRAREDVTHALAPSLTASGRGVDRIGETRGQDPVAGRVLPAGLAADVAPTLNAGGNQTGGDRPYGTSVDTIEALVVHERLVSFPPEIAHTLRADGFDASEDGTGRGTPLVPMAFGGNNTAGPIDVATARNAHAGPAGRLDFESETFVCEPIPILEPGARTGVSTTDARAGLGIGDPGDPMFTLQAGRQHAVFAASEPVSFNARQDPDFVTGLTGPIDTDGYTQAVAFDTTQITSAANRSNPQPGDPCHPVVAQGHAPAIAFSLRGRDGENQIEPEAGEVAPAVRTGGGGSSKSFVASVMDEVRWAVRRLTPRECERLQGTADNFTRIPWRGAAEEDCPDGPRYKVIGNSMAGAVMAWLGQRIKDVEARRP